MPKPKAQTRSVLVDGKVVPPTGVEVIVADHCNIACRQCNHGAPAVPKWNASAADVARDLSLLARHYRPAFLKYIGGEPLLHPDLVSILKAGRESGIADHHLLVTNGMLLGRMDDAVWPLIDELEISVYPGAGLSEELLERCRQLAAAHGVTLTINHFPEFRRTFTRVRNTDEALVERIFRGCKTANVWGCHTLYRGALYRCPQSAYALTLAKAEGFDGLRLDDGPDFTARLLAFLNERTPLASCAYCVGTAGRKEPHKLLKRTEWVEDLDEPAERMLDPALLAENVAAIVTLDDCKTPEFHRYRSPLKRLVRGLGVKPRRLRRATSLRSDLD